MLLLKKVCTPEAIVELGTEKINQIWRDAKLRDVGMKRAMPLCETAKRSIGLKNGSLAVDAVARGLRIQKNTAGLHYGGDRKDVQEDTRK